MKFRANESPNTEHPQFVIHPVHRTSAIRTCRVEVGRRRNLSRRSRTEAESKIHPSSVAAPEVPTHLTGGLRRVENPKCPIGWHLTFNGQDAQFKHEQCAFYVAWLLLNPPTEPIHGLG